MVVQKSNLLSSNSAHWVGKIKINIWSDDFQHVQVFLTENNIMQPLIFQSGGFSSSLVAWQKFLKCWPWTWSTSCFAWPNFWERKERRYFFAEPPFIIQHTHTNTRAGGKYIYIYERGLFWGSALKWELSAGIVKAAATPPAKFVKYFLHAAETMSLAIVRVLLPLGCCQIWSSPNQKDRPTPSTVYVASRKFGTLKSLRCRSIVIHINFSGFREVSLRTPDFGPGDGKSIWKKITLYVARIMTLTKYGLAFYFLWVWKYQYLWFYIGP